jgi:DNA-binding phage protein
MVRVSEFDPGAFLDDDEVVAEYLTAALEDDNPDILLAAVRHVEGAGRERDRRTRCSRLAKRAQQTDASTLPLSHATIQLRL